MFCMQLQNERDELTSKLTVKEDQLTKLKDENKKILLQKSYRSKEPSMSVKLETEQVHIYRALSGKFSKILLL